MVEVRERYGILTINFSIVPFLKASSSNSKPTNRRFTKIPTFIRPSRFAAPPELIFDMNTPSSYLFSGFPRWPRKPPLMCIPSLSPGSRTIVSSYNENKSVNMVGEQCVTRDYVIHTSNPSGNGSCWIFNVISLAGFSRARTASWCVYDVMSSPFTLKIRSPIRSLPDRAAIPPGTIWNR